ncbi:MAG TPA: ABC transporter permease, partial [Anaerolineaceae bacterium]|nr:ABC transporter permease [Anaerolineaceae bacterium]
LGVVDQTGLIARAEATLDQDLIVSPLSAYPDEESARKAADEGLILGYYVLEDSFAQDGAARLVLQKQGGIMAITQFEDVVRVALLVNSGYDRQKIMRIVSGARIDYEPLDAAAQNLPEDDASRSNAPLILKLAGVVVAFILQFVFFMGINMVNGYVIRILLEERENRTLELLATSVPTRTLLSSKFLANTMVGLTHVLTWVVLGGLAIVLLSGSTKIFASVDLLRVVLVVLYLILGFIFVGGLNSMIASLVPKPQLASMLTGLITLPTMIPFLATQAIADQPGSTLAIVLSMIPVTAIQAVPVRLIFAIPPWWELLISITLLAAAAYLAMRLASWAFQRSIRSGGASLVRIKPFWRRRARGGSHAK